MYENISSKSIVELEKLKKKKHSRVILATKQVSHLFTYKQSQL